MSSILADVAPVDWVLLRRQKFISHVVIMENVPIGSPDWYVGQVGTGNASLRANEMTQQGTARPRTVSAKPKE